MKVKLQIGPNTTDLERVVVGVNLNDFVVLDYTQQNYKLYNQLLKQQNEGMGQSFYDSGDQMKLEEDHSLLERCSMPISDLIQKYEKCVLFCKHSSFVNSTTDFLEFILSI